jgi:cytochrome c553
MALVALGFSSVVVSAKDAASGAVTDREVQAKATYCEVCHGVEARGFRGYYPIPRLAGQQPDYLKNQLQAFIEHRRTNNIMFNVGHVMSPAMIEGLTANFKALDPKPLGGAPRNLGADGKEIFQNGVAASNVPACASCHGADAKGNGPFPRLAGQVYEYVVNKLKNWDKERGQDPKNPDTSAVMEPIAHNLSDQQMKAVAAYVSELE